jgi:Uma2 family endonuclease
MATATVSLPSSAAVSGDSLHEVVDGIVVEKPMSALATLITFQLAKKLDAHVAPHRLGTIVPEMLFILDEGANLRRRPDVAFVTADQWPIDRLPPAHGDWLIAPALAIEVLSPGNTFGEVLSKMDEYFDAGVREVWLIVPEQRRIYVHRSPLEVRILSADQVLTTDLIPALSLPVGEIIPALP